MENTNELLSFRNYLNDGVAKFITHLDGPSNLSIDTLTEIIIVLSNYQEEGVSLFPVVFISNDFKSILPSLHGNDLLNIGTGDISASTIQTAFKKCAPIAEGRQWAIAIEVNDNILTYGLFRTEQSPLTPTAFERLRLTQNKSLNLIGITRHGGNFIEVRSSNGEFHYIDILGKQEEANNPPRLIRNFLKTVVKDAPEDLKIKLNAFYYRIVVDLLHANHGTLVAVIAHDKPIPDFFSDGTLFKEPVDVLNAISLFSHDGDNEAYQRLYSYGELFKRMTNMDGITLISTNGAILGYNCFIQNSILNYRPNPKNVTGGARRRAFEVMCSFLGDSLKAVLYRSQDGHSSFEKVD